MYSPEYRRILFKLAQKLKIKLPTGNVSVVTLTQIFQEELADKVREHDLKERNALLKKMVTNQKARIVALTDADASAPDPVSAPASTATAPAPATLKKALPWIAVAASLLLLG